LLSADGSEGLAFARVGRCQACFIFLYKDFLLKDHNFTRVESLEHYLLNKLKIDLKHSLFTKGNS
ncbi:hypothetical protein LI012_18650, partial [Caldibacillus thermoamylovorans]|uniref:hypothetical protein n=1 Tax=Caldibacillus thermoamylovorans TaxID=35841 RepID=UPI001D06F59E